MQQRQVYIGFLLVLLVGSSCGLLRHTGRGGEAGQVRSLRRQVVKEAMSYTGIPYCNGGMDTRCLDCSGLVCLSYKNTACKLPRTCAEMAALGKEVGESSAQPGDLIFFNTSRKSGKVLNHVGIVISEPGKPLSFLHSSSSKGVMQNRLDEPYYRKAFVKIVVPPCME